MPKGLTVGGIYDLAVRLGLDADPRGEARVKEILDHEQRRFDELPKDKQQYFDKEALRNPYPDTRILYGDTQKPVKKVLAGVDIDSTEILLADRLNERGASIDAVVAHHPEGLALAQLDTQLALQSDLLANYGVPIHIGESLLEKRIAELGRMLAPVNHNRSVDVARLLDMPFLCTHTATDNLVYQFLKRYISDRTPVFVDDIIDILMTLPEYQAAETIAAGPHIVSGHGKRRTGKIAFTDVTGGTEGANEAYEYLSRSGVGTIVAMHMREEPRKVAEKFHINVVIAGHISSDSLGMNLMLDHLEAAGIEIVPAGGLLRVSRPAVQANQLGNIG